MIPRPRSISVGAALALAVFFGAADAAPRSPFTWETEICPLYLRQKAHAPTEAGLRKKNSDLKRTDRPAGGTQGGRWFVDPDGDYWFGKSYDGNFSRVANEALVNEIYANLGASVAKVRIESIDGRIYFLSKEVKAHAASFEDLRKGPVLDHFVVDALLANWDVIGLELDNVLVDERHAYRIDNGGALLFRAMGERRPFPVEVEEIFSMREKGTVFAELGDLEVAGQIRRLLERYSTNSESIHAAILRSGLPEEDALFLLRRLDERMYWLATTGLERLERGVPESARWIPEIRGRYERLYFSKSGSSRTRIAQKEYGWSDEEVVAVEDYLGGDFDKINAILRESGPERWGWLTEEAKRRLYVETYRPTIEVIRAALRKLPDYSGPVTRMTTTGYGNLERYAVGRIVTEKGLTSTTRAKGWPYEGDLFLEIHAKHGKDLSTLNPHESEVLFLPGSRFRVLKKWRSEEDGRWHVELEEVD